MKPKELEKMVHSDGKLHVIYVGPTGGLEVAGMRFPHEVEVRLSPSKADRIVDEIWSVLKVARPAPKARE